MATPCACENWLLCSTDGLVSFIDKSGIDHHESPYEVLAGVAIKDESLWGLIGEIHDAELSHFGRRYSGGARELKGKKF